MKLSKYFAKEPYCAAIALKILLLLMAAFILSLFLMMPLVLGSWYALIVFGFYPLIIVIRLRDEETLLTRELPGYEAYKQKVKYRIIPFIW